MAGPYEAVISIGGQSLVDGVWRMLGPALSGLTNPLPIAIPGFVNSQFRITQIFPTLPANGRLNVLALIDVSGEALLGVRCQSEGVSVSLGGQSLTFPPVPFPSVVPVAVDLTPQRPLVFAAALQLGAIGPSLGTRGSMLFMTLDVAMGTLPTLDPSAVTAVTKKLGEALEQIVRQLGIPGDLSQPIIDESTVRDLLEPVPGIVASVFDDALSRLVAQTGRLIFPSAGVGASCEALCLPSFADAKLTPHAEGSYVLQLGFGRSGHGDIPDFPTFQPGIPDCSVTVGNRFVFQLLCCLVERLPTFAFPFAAESGTTDINGAAHLQCCTFRFVKFAIGPVTLGGGADDGISICMDSGEDGRKSFVLVGHFTLFVPSRMPVISKILDVELDFELPIHFDLDDMASITNLRLAGIPIVEASVRPAFGLKILLAIVAATFILGGGLIGILGGGLAASIAAVVVGPVIAATVLLLVWFACDILSWLLGQMPGSLINGASPLKSPAAVPPGVFDAFGRLAASTVSIDDLVADGVLHTPTSPWALLPRFSFQRTRPPRDLGTIDTGKPDTQTES